MRSWKVGELAKRTGLSVRTLHHYDAIGLLSPTHRSQSGHRLYGEGDVARLQQVMSLRSLGFPLEEIRDLLDRRGMSPGDVVRLHLHRLREQIRMQRRLLDRLEAVEAGLRSAERVSAEELMKTIEEMTMFDRYYSPEQLDQLQERARQVGPERIREVEAEWPRLMDEVRAEMEKGTDPSDPRVQELARRWMGLVREFTGGDPGITQSLKSLWQNEEQVHGIDTGPAREMMAYVTRALEAAGEQPL